MYGIRIQFDMRFSGGSESSELKGTFKPVN